MIEVFRLYGIVIAEFLFELLVFCALFFRTAARPRGFWWKCALSVLLLFALGIPVAWFYSLFGETVWGRILVYLFLFLAVILFAFWSFGEPFFAALFRCTLAYAAQNLVYKLFLIFWTGGEAFRIFDGWGENFDLWYRLVYYAFFALCTVAVYFGFVRGMEKRMQSCRFDYGMLAITVFVLGVTVLLCSFEDVCFSRLCVERENRFGEPVYVVLRQTGNVFSAVCCVIVFLLAAKTVVARELSREVEYLRYAIRQSELQYRISKDTIDLINVKCHDIRYKLGMIAAQGGHGLEDLKKNISIYDSRIETGSPLLNVLFTEKSLFCEQNSINISCMIDGAKLSFIEEGDLYCLFGNLLDNALEAVKDIAEPERRVIDLVVKAKDGLLLVQEENYFDGTLEFEDGLPLTTKGDRGYHGFGMRSLRLLARKYGGELSAFVKGDVFHLNIIFSVGEESASVPAENA